MQKGYVKFLKSYKFKGRSFKEGEVVSVDEIELTPKQMSVLISEKVAVPCATRTGTSYGGVTSVR